MDYGPLTLLKTAKIAEKIACNLKN